MAFVALLQLREMTLERVVAWILAVDLVVASGQSDEVIPYLRRKLVDCTRCLLRSC
jgi:hypothetical protein